MATIRKKNEKWHVQIRRTSCPQLTKTFVRKADALEWARMQELKVDRQELGPSYKLLEKVSLFELVERYISEYASRKKSAAVEVVTLTKFLSHPISQKKISNLTIEDFKLYRDERLKSITSKSLKRQLSPLSHMFHIAKTEWGYPIRENFIGLINLKTEDSRRDRRLRQGEYEALISGCKLLRNSYLSDIIVIALETGMRRGEIINIQKQHLDEFRAELKIPTTKNGTPRTIPLTALALYKINSRFNNNPCDQAKLFQVSPIAVRQAWDRLTNKIGINDLGVHPISPNSLLV